MTVSHESTAPKEDPSARRFALIAAVVAALISLVPYLLAELVLKPRGSLYLGGQMANDDLMVYAAWMRQAMDGNFLFDNRFTSPEGQPKLTIHLWFLILGFIAKGFGIPATLALTKAAATGWLTWLIYRLWTRISSDNYVHKLGLLVGMLGGGLGFAVWQNFGVAFDPPHPLGAMTRGGLPIDVWQGEAFVFPSVLINGLFVISLCLILVIFIAVLDARSTSSAVWKGALAFFVLMNIHSYDVLLIAMVLVGLLASSLASGSANSTWIKRVFLMSAGALPSAAWFGYVYQADSVFRHRASVPTLSANFGQYVLGLLPMLLLGLFALVPIVRNAQAGPRFWHGNREAGPIAVMLLMGVLLVMSLAIPASEGFWLTLPAWLLVFGLGLGVVALCATGHAGIDLAVSWAVIGLIAPYFPTFFQRKLAMGLSLPWAILASIGLGVILHQRERGLRNLIAIGSVLLLSATSLRWMQRELFFQRENVSSTTVHPVFASADVARAIDHLNQVPGVKTVFAMPGVPNQVGVADFSVPVVIDTNPILSGFTGVYTFAGHWGETPDYLNRRNQMTALFASLSMPEEERQELVGKADYVLAPNPTTYASLGETQDGSQRRFQIQDLSRFGEVVLDGTQFRLIRVRK